MYLALAVIVVGLSIRISYYVDLIDKTTDISGAFIGGVMLAAVTTDLSFTTASIYTSNSQSHNLVFFGLISTFAILGILVANIYKEKLSRKVNEAIYMGGGIISIMGYLLFLTLSK